MKVAVAEINVDQSHRRPLNQSKLQDIAESINEIGLLHPILIDTDKKLIAGWHRLEAHKLLGRTEIEAEIKDYEPVQKELAEIDENLQRAELHYLDQGRQLKRRKELYETLHPETKRGGDRRSSDFKIQQPSMVPSFVKDAANKTGYTIRTIHQDIQLADKMAPEIQQKVKEIELPKDEALKLIRKAPSAPAQKEYLEKIESGAARSVAEATKLLEREKRIISGSRVKLDLEEANLILGDGISFLPSIDPDSYDAIISEVSTTDQALAILEYGARILKPGGVIALKICPYYLPDIFALKPKPANLLTDDLKFTWCMASMVAINKPADDEVPSYVSNGWSPIVIFTKGDTQLTRLNDVVEKGLDHFTEKEDAAVQVISKLTKPGSIILDPLLTESFPTYLSVTTTRKFTGYSDSQEKIDFARTHIKDIAAVINRI